MFRRVACLVIVAACAKDAPAPAPQPPTEVTADERARAAQIVGELKRSLVGALGQAIGKGGPASAIPVCHTEAPALTAALARDGVTIGRATRKPRNPANEAKGWQADALAQFEQQHAAKQLAGATFTRRLPDGRAAYAEPLVINDLCLACHGTSLAPDVQAAIAERYPSDRATGYQAGELRGVAWVELPAK